MPKRLVQSYTNRYLDLVLEKLELPSDYALADVLNVSTQAIYKMRGGGAMSTTTAARIAEILELDPLKVIAESELERGSDQELWKRIRDAAAVLLPVIAGVMFGAGVPSPAEASSHAAVRGERLCIMSNRRWWLGPLSPFFPGGGPDDELPA